MRVAMKPHGYRLLMTVDAVGGVWRYGLDAAQALTQAGVEVTLATLGPAASDEQREEAEGIEGLRLVQTGEALDWLCESREDVRRAAEVVSNLAREVGADLVQLNGTALAADAEFPAPVVAAHHSCLATWWASVKNGAPPQDWAWRRELTRDHLHRAAALAAPTRAFAQATASTYALRETPRVIYNGRPQPGPSSSAGSHRLFTAGRLWDEGKNVGTLDRAAARIEAPVLAAGAIEGPRGQRVSSPNLHLLGALTEGAIREQLEGRPIFVSIPLYEPFGLAILEAAQAGCALILSDIATLRELWEGAAIFVPARDDAALAQTANLLLRDAALRNRLAVAAQERSKLYSLRRFAESLLAWHRDVLGRGREDAA